MRYFSLFTGIGGLDSGLVKAGWECAGYSEIKDSSINIYRSHYPDHKNYGDITKINFSSLPDFDLLTGGFPCQSFSMIGLRKGFNDPRGIMILHVRNLLVAKQPRYAVLENVKGILSHDNGRTYVKILQLLQSAGYYVRVVMLNALHYGTAQSRERVFFLCCREDFEKVNPIIIDDTKTFKDVVDTTEIVDFVPNSPRNIKKINQECDINFELIGMYDRVGTLVTQFGCGEKLVGHHDRMRYLTPLECERLQGFPDGWTEGETKNNRYWALGNAVNCKVSAYLFNAYLKNVWFN
jgi:DNA (cytosine-5)-methyltransferase 1